MSFETGLTGLAILVVGACVGVVLAELWWWLSCPQVRQYLEPRDCDCLDPDCHHIHQGDDFR